MAVFKCKMCGGTMEINNNETVATCDYCGVQQTLPKLDDEKRLNLFGRANHFRRNNEFDKAMGIYEQILNEDKTDAESYWSLVLCRYGIEYVEDPASHKRVPTVNRAQFTSIFDDADYKSALEYADSLQKTIYEDEARAINEIQKGILAISQKEEPFDVFICYKESDNNGRRTPDSVLANDIYHQLTQEGFKVFFARITLEDKLGSAYEPYIFAALNSAKVMVVLGTKPEYFNAVWVKNEWSRYLALVKASNGKKMLIPAYKDMDPYDLPEEFSHLQAQDMSKLGFMQDLIRGIKKIAQDDEPKATVIKETVVTEGNANINALLERVSIFLEDKDWSSADEYCEKVLDIEPKNAEAYLGKLMAELRVSNKDALKNVANPFDDRNNYQKVMRYGDEALKKELQEYVEFIKERNEKTYLENTYNSAKNKMNSAETENEYKKAAIEFESISTYKDAAALVNKCLEKAEIARKDAIYEEAKAEMTGEEISDIEYAIELFETISGWKDADEQILVCQKRVEELKAEEDARRIEEERKAEEERLEKERVAEEKRIAKEKLKKKIKKALISILSSIVSIALVLTLVTRIVIPSIKINNAMEYIDTDDFDSASDILDELGDSELVKSRIYDRANEFLEAKDYEMAKQLFSYLDDYKDSDAKWEKCYKAIAKTEKAKTYSNAVELMEAGDYRKAISEFKKIKDYKDCKSKIKENYYLLGKKYLQSGKQYQAAVSFAKSGNYKDAKEQSKKLWDKLAVRATISADDKKTAAIKNDGSVIVAGMGGFPKSNDIIEISAAYNHIIGLKSDGTVIASGYNSYGACDVENWTDIVAIDTGFTHTVGLKSDGTVIATEYIGDYYNGQCNVEDWTDIIAISACSDLTVGLKSDGTVVAAGNNVSGQCNVEDWTDIVAISAGSGITVGLKSDGDFEIAGDGDDDIIYIFSGWYDLVAVSVGFNHMVGLKSDGTVVASGNNECGQCNVEDWTDIVAISAGDEHTVGLKSDGTVVATKYLGDMMDYDNQCDVGELKNIKLPEKK